jgi:hypothetical protein
MPFDPRSTYATSAFASGGVGADGQPLQRYRLPDFADRDIIAFDLGSATRCRRGRSPTTTSTR